MMEYFKTIPQEYYLYAGIGIIILGIILGFTRTIIVYRDYADLTKVFMLVNVPVGLFYMLGEKIENQTLKYIILGVEGLILVWIIISTIIDNKNIFKILLALITKISLGVIFAIYLMDLISPSGKTKTIRSKNRGISALVMLFLAPILYGLVRNKGWMKSKDEK